MTEGGFLESDLVPPWHNSLLLPSGSFSSILCHLVGSWQDSWGNNAGLIDSGFGEHGDRQGGGELWTVVLC